MTCTGEARGLLVCAALAAGEFAAAHVPEYAETWPAVAIVALLVALFGYGYGWRLTRCAVFFLIGFALFCQASVESEHRYRESPWMRAQDARRHRVAKRTTNAVKRDFSRRIGIGLEHDRTVADLNRAILLGERANLPYETRRVFVESGTMHVFAISGLHVMMVARVLVTALSLFLIPYRWLGLAAIPLLWGYVALIGFAPSAVRAASMASLYFLAPVFWRRPNAISAWTITFLAVHLFRPRMIVDVGCALSFAVMLAIVLGARFAERLGGWRATLFLTLAAWSAGVPIAAHVFGRVTPGGLLANIPLIFAAQYSVAAGFCGIAASYVSETLAAHLNNFAALFTKAMLALSSLVARLPGANFEMVDWSLVTCAGWYLAIALAVILARSVRSRHLI